MDEEREQDGINYAGTRSAIRDATTAEMRTKWATEHNWPLRFQLWTKARIREFCAANGITPVADFAAVPVTQAPVTLAEPVQVEKRWKADAAGTATAPCGKTSRLKRSLIQGGNTIPIDTAYHCGERTCTICNKNAQAKLTVSRDFPQGMSKGFQTGSYDDGSIGSQNTAQSENQPNSSLIKTTDEMVSASEQEGGKAAAEEAREAMQAKLDAMRAKAEQAMAATAPKVEDAAAESESSSSPHDQTKSEQPKGKTGPQAANDSAPGGQGKGGGPGQGQGKPDEKAECGQGKGDAQGDGAPPKTVAEKLKAEKNGGDKASDKAGQKQSQKGQPSGKPGQGQPGDSEQGDGDDEEMEPENPLHNLIRQLAREEDDKGDYAPRDEVVEGLVEATKGLVTEHEVRQIIKSTPAGLDQDRVAAIAAAEAVGAAGQMGEVVMAETLKIVDERARAIANELLNSQIKRTIEVQVGTNAPVVIDGLTHYAFERMIERHAMGFNNLFLIGPAGTGKTTLAKQMAKALNRQFGFLGLTAGISEAHLSGRFLPIGEKGTYLLSRFVDVYENGGVFLLDEMDGADANVLLTINEALANEVMPVPNRFDNPIAYRHADTVIIGAANTFGHGADRVYVGRNQLDAATLDRFVGGTFELDYDRSMEGKLVGTLVGGKPGEALCKRYWDIRDKVYAAKMRRVWGTRGLLASGRMVKSGMKVEDAIRQCTVGWKADELNKVGIAA